MFKNEKEQFICNDVPNLKLQLKNKDKVILETILDTLTFFHGHVSSGNHQINFKVATFDPEEYRTIVENITAITEINVTAEFLFAGENNTIVHQNIIYPPFNRIVVTKEMSAETNPSCFEFDLFKY